MIRYRCGTSIHTGDSSGTLHELRSPLECAGPQGSMNVTKPMSTRISSNTGKVGPLRLVQYDSEPTVRKCAPNCEASSRTTRSPIYEDVTGREHIWRTPLLTTSSDSRNEKPSNPVLYDKEHAVRKNAPEGTAYRQGVSLPSARRDKEVNGGDSPRRTPMVAMSSSRGNDAHGALQKVGNNGPHGEF